MNRKPSQQITSPDGGAPGGLQATLVARRRLLRGGLAAAPVLMVSSPRSVMAGACTTSSAAGSISVSGPADKIYTCSGKAPDYWANSLNYSLWPSPYVAVGDGLLVTPTLFDSALGLVSTYAGKTMLDVLKLPATTGKDGLAKLIAAALLNATKGYTQNVLSPNLVKNIWKSYVKKGYGWWEPTAGVRWYADSSVPVGSGGCIAWLTSTMS